MSILVTGGSKGIGRGICLEFAAPGVDVFINFAHDGDAAAETAHAVEERGATAHLIRGDVGDPIECQDILAQVAGTVDQLDQLVHAAVYPHQAPTLQLPSSEFERAVKVNGNALLYLVQAADKLLVRGSSVFFLSSRGAKYAVPGYAAVGAPKAMAEALVRYLAVELAPRGARINTVTASALLTDAFRAAVPDADERFAALARRNPSGRNLEIDDVAKAVKFLSSPAAEMINGTELLVDGGQYSTA